jgi:hypothetical protein
MNMGVRQGVAMDSLKFHPGLPCPTLLRLAGGLPAAVFYPFGHPTPYAYVHEVVTRPIWITTTTRQSKPHDLAQIQFSRDMALWYGTMEH